MNINNNATIILTDYGKQILDEYRINLEKEIRFKFTSDVFCYDKDGKFQDSLWQIMNIFGSKFYCGAKQIFLNNEINIDED